MLREGFPFHQFTIQKSFTQMGSDLAQIRLTAAGRIYQLIYIEIESVQSKFLIKKETLTFC